jgi:hypothetical protein
MGRLASRAGLFLGRLIMPERAGKEADPLSNIVKTEGEEPLFR